MCDLTGMANRISLVTLSLGTFGKSCASKTGTEALKSEFQTDAGKASVVLTNHRALVELSKLHGETRRRHAALTRPTVNDGMRMIARGRQLDYMVEMDKFHQKHDILVTQFLADYDQERDSAPERLGGLYDPNKWPDKGEVQDKFNFEIRVLPCPSDGEWGEWLRDSAEAAETELREQLRAALLRLVDRFGADRKPVESVTGNLAALLDLIPSLNLTGAADISQVAQAASEVAVPVQSIVDNPQERKRLAERANALAGLLGGGKR